MLQPGVMVVLLILVIAPCYALLTTAPKVINKLLYSSQYVSWRGDFTDKHTTAVFIGHRDCYDLSEIDVIPAIERAIALGITTFLNGGMGHFDKITALAVHTLKSKYPNVRLLWIKAYPAQKISYAHLFDDSGLYALDWHIEHIGVRKAIPERNEYLLQHSSVAICHVVHQSSGAYKTYLKAKNLGLSIIDI